MTALITMYFSINDFMFILLVLTIYLIIKIEMPLTETRGYYKRTMTKGIFLTQLAGYTLPIVFLLMSFNITHASMVNREIVFGLFGALVYILGVIILPIEFFIKFWPSN